ncbi:Glycosyltransferase involved in cell wall bisynthesis [Pontibacter akesuensis]|uniref:Glycosyltransferase involved in cell wall bisynthesis n=2 Tax=Pontibacter akesuensis TaxID=388950 RepID=A0A1I7H5A6_9BACT|nr:Glycosyltransferase involved in cell wall bisynthesis [Pontibacter akesuensis]
MLLPETLKYHDKHKFEFHYIFFLPWKNQMVEAIEIHSGKVTCLEASNNIQIFQKVPALIQYIRQHRIQLIHCHLPWAGIAGRIAAKAANVPVVYTEHNNFSRYHSLTKIASRLTMQLNQLIIPVSGDAEQALRKFVSDAKLKLILNGVDTVAFTRNNEKQDLRRELNIPEEHIVVTTAAVFREQKRLDNFIKIAKGVSAKFKNVSFVLVGDGPEKEKILELSKPLLTVGNIYFAGLQQNVKPYFNITDIYLMTSDFEGLPIALLEAMSMGCAVVATSVGGIPEVIENGVSGLLSQAGDVDSLEKDVTLLIENKDMRVDLAIKARERIVQHFSMKKMVQELEDVYRQYAKDRV